MREHAWSAGVRARMERAIMTQLGGARARYKLLCCCFTGVMVVVVVLVIARRRHVAFRRQPIM